MKNISELKRAPAQPRATPTRVPKTMPRKSPLPRTKSSGFPHAQARNSQSAQKTYERYLALARAEALAGDRITAENYFQHAEHYLRSLEMDTN